MAIWRARHASGRSGVPYDEATLAAMCFFIALAMFFVWMAIWGFGLFSGWRFV